MKMLGEHTKTWKSRREYLYEIEIIRVLLDKCCALSFASRYKLKVHVVAAFCCIEFIHIFINSFSPFNVFRFLFCALERSLQVGCEKCKWLVHCCCIHVRVHRFPSRIHNSWCSVLFIQGSAYSTEFIIELVAAASEGDWWDRKRDKVACKLQHFFLFSALFSRHS